MAQGPVAVMVSGGSDSLTLLACAERAGIRTAAVAVDTGLCPAGEIERAGEFARLRGIPFILLTVDMLQIDAVRMNAHDRCYWCKEAMLRAIGNWAESHAFGTIMDGTNADDRPEERPGMRALAEFGVVSPFARCGIGKEKIATLAKRLDVPLIPSSSCMATRFPEGHTLTPQEIERVRRAEALLRPHVTGRLRVRVNGRGASIVADETNFDVIERYRDDILALGFDHVDTVPTRTQSGEMK